MSISNPKAENPCRKFIDYKGDKGQFFYYDKEQEKQIEVTLPIYFVVLDELATITGYNKKHDCGIYSNEVHRTADELLRVKTFKGGEEIVGLYNDIKDSIVALGGKYTKSVYVLLLSADGSSEMANFKFRGAAFSGWLDKKFNVSKSAVGIMGFKDEVNGSITYKIPVFQKFKLSEEWRMRAVATDQVLQEYLEQYFLGAPQKPTETAIPASISNRLEEKASEVIDPIAGIVFPGKGNEPPEDIPWSGESSDDELSDLPF